MSEATFKVKGIIYPFPTQFRLGDGVLVREVTGVDIEDLQDAGTYTKVTGYLAAAIWQANPTWPRSKVVKFVEQLSVGEFEVEGDDPDDPPVARVEESPSPATSGDSTTTPEPSTDLDLV